MGQQDTIQLFTIVNYFLIGQGGAYFFGIVMKVGINGLWYGMGLGLALNTTGYIALLTKFDWQEISRECQDEMNNQLDFLQDSTDISDIEEYV